MASKMKYGWIPDLPDQRDMLFAATMATKTLPPKVSLRAQCPPIYETQGQLGCCTGFGIAAALQFGRKKQMLTPDFIPSQLFIYYNERVIEGTVDVDGGAQIRHGMKSVADLGACPLDAWPYDIAQFRTKPPEGAYVSALDHQAILYQRVSQTLSQMKGCIASGFPFVFGFTVYESFENDETMRTGDVQMPASAERMLSGHCMVAVGYDDSSQRFEFRNSWGETYGDGGYGTIPYAYLTDPSLSADFWTIRLVE